MLKNLLFSFHVFIIDRQANNENFCCLKKAIRNISDLSRKTLSFIKMYDINIINANEKTNLDTTNTFNE